MKPVALRTARLVLDQPRAADVDAITSYCQDPLFERYLTTPWPYRREDAEYFVTSHVPNGWAAATEFTWALRAGDDLMGVIGLRTEREDVGFWLGAPFRRHGYMAEALAAVCDVAFETLGLSAVQWECFDGNTASAATARAAGFTYTGFAPADVPARDGSRPPAWHGILRPTDSRDPKPGWPLTD